MVCGFGVLYSKGIIGPSAIIYLLLLITLDSVNIGLFRIVCAPSNLSSAQDQVG